MLSNTNKMAYFYTTCTVCVTILVLVVKSARFQILRSYTQVTRSYALLIVYARCYEVKKDCGRGGCPVVIRS